ncbi:insulin-like growth factor-binding protein 7 isoform X2 [Microcaecilia unicolor]|uniref:Insulin-like growth factor-binding protein 7 isoform X2 n=1 Tax=Microcaecilia unicolor TaxID=1415580 RepID=A0A6P7XJF5_9AMPH|nr:insulin-like growth factor-binding protein 7 isoform X2 [Microcaecilia unicolor]
MKRLCYSLLLLPALLWVSGWAAKDPRPKACGQCLRALCAPLPAGGCKLGAVLDSCGCCALCAAGEGEACGVAGARCAAGSECLRSGRGSVCVCKSRQPVCGSDGITYPSGCALRAANLREKSGIRQLSKGPCKRAPSIVTPPKDVWNISGAQVYLSCEVIGIPTPILTWNKVIRGHHGVRKMELLPGDRENLAIQTRGGPEKHEVTGWVLLSPLRKEDAGEYECQATNSGGQAAASAKITIVNTVHEIPMRKAQDTEL